MKSAKIIANVATALKSQRARLSGHTVRVKKATGTIGARNKAADVANIHGTLMRSALPRVHIRGASVLLRSSIEAGTAAAIASV
jgi:hypothetical protein